MAFSIKSPIGYAVVGSFFLHIFLVSVYGNLLTSGEIPLPPPPQKKFKIEMVAKKPQPVKKVEVIENKIIEPKTIKPIKIKKPHTTYSAHKIRKNEIALSPVPQKAPVKPKMVQDQNIHSAKKMFQTVRAKVSTSAVTPLPRKIEKLQTSKFITAKVQRSSAEKAKPTEFFPPPRPVKNAPSIFTTTGNKKTFHESLVAFAPAVSKRKSASVTRFSSSEGMTNTRIHVGPKAIAHNPLQARTLTVAKTQGVDQKKAVAIKSGPPSRSLTPKLVAIRPSAPEFESVTTPDRAARFYEAKTRNVSTLPSPRVSRTASSSSRRSGGFRRTGIVQKGDLFAAATIPIPRPVPNIVDKGILDGYLGTLQKLIASAKQYPESARKSEQEGKVTVQFTVMKNGTVKNIQLVSKTNYHDLDKEAIEAVKRAAPFSDFPDEIGKPFLDIILPFRFKLNE